MELHQANREWASRPEDQRHLSLLDMLAAKQKVRDTSRGAVVPSNKIQVIPTSNWELAFTGGGRQYVPTNWAFGQACKLVKAPADYLSTIPAPQAADCLNYGFGFARDISDTGLLLQSEGLDHTLRAVTGPNYGRVWDCDVIQQLIDRFGDGVTGDFRVPGEFGKQVPITKANTTLYSSDRDMFVFLADEQNRVELPDRRAGKFGSFARGFFICNSEVGKARLLISTFLFDYTCSNRIVWGAENFQELAIRHTSGAPERFVEEVAPALITYAHTSTAGITEALQDAKAQKMGDKLDEFLANRFGKGKVQPIKKAFEVDEGRPIETRWDVVTGATAYARALPHQDARLEIEREAGKLLKAA